ncbi:MAG: MATE family efflux transporter [Gammaproteobacteria bacterium]|nr:MATE family efflux transporter [Gammaproteobacteria bacterium]
MQLNRQHVLANERISKLLWQFSLPAMVGMLVQTFYNVIDTIFIGHSVGVLGIAALSIVFPIQILITAIAQLISTGSATLISIALGAKRPDEANLVFGNAICLAIITGIIITAVGLWDSAKFLAIFGSTPSILPYARQFMNVILLGVPFVMFAMAGTGIARAEGNVKMAMYSMIFSAVLNTILDPIFIIWLHMGVKGAAIATLIAQIFAACFMLYYFAFGNSSLQIVMKNFVLRGYLVLKIAAIGSSSLVRIASSSLSLVVLNHLLGIYGGDSAIAVYGILSRVLMSFFMPILGIAQGLQPILGFNYGAKLIARVRESIKKANVIATVISVISFVVIFSFPKIIFNIFTNDPVLIAEGKHAILFITPTLSLVGFQMITATMFQSLGKVKPALLLSSLRGLLFLIPALLILAPLLKLNGIWLAFPIADILAFSVTFMLYRPQMRKFKNEAAT